MIGPYLSYLFGIITIPFNLDDVGFAAVILGFDTVHQLHVHVTFNVHLWLGKEKIDFVCVPVLEDGHGEDNQYNIPR